ncbi:MAG: 6-pyruvoyl-tetrahydropterin synthase-related protein [Pyrinomonadaceae bacterium]
MILDRLKNRLGQRLFSIFLMGLLALAAAFPIVFFGIPHGPDLAQHFQFAASVNESLSNGVLIPPTSPKANHGLGDYGIRFYPPLSYLALSLIFKVINSWYYATAFFVFLLFWFSGIGVEMLTREYFTNKEAIFAGAIFMLAPYHLNQIYNSFLFAEFAAVSVIPFCLLFISRICRSAKFADTIGLAVSLSLLFLTHIPTSIMCAIVFPVFTLVILYRSGISVAKILNLVAGGLLAIASTSFYWIKVVTEQKWIKHTSPEYFDGVYGFRDNFLGNLSSILNFQDDVRALWLPNLILFATLFLCLPTVIMLFRSRLKRSDLLIASGTVLVISVFFTAFPSQFIWENSSIIQILQFPWRFLGFVSIAAAVFASIGIVAVSDMIANRQNVPATIGLGLILTVFVFSAAFIPRQATFNSRANFGNEQVEILHGAASNECWQTNWVPGHGIKPADLTNLVRDRSQLSVTSSSRSFALSNADSGLIELPVYYYPYWTAFSGEKELPVKSSERGLITIDAPNPISKIFLEFREPGVVRVARFFSAGVWIMLLIFSGYYLIWIKLREDKA